MSEFEKVILKKAIHPKRTILVDDKEGLARIKFSGHVLVERGSGDRGILNPILKRRWYKRGDKIFIRKIQFHRSPKKILDAIIKSGHKGPDRLVYSFLEALEIEKPEYYFGYKIEKILSQGKFGNGECHVHPILYVAYESGSGSIKRVYFELKQFKLVLNQSDLIYMYAAQMLMNSFEVYTWLFRRSTEVAHMVIAGPAKVIGKRMAQKSIRVICFPLIRKVCTRVPSKLIFRVISGLENFIISFCKSIVEDFLKNRHLSAQLKKDLGSNNSVGTIAMSATYDFVDAAFVSQWERKIKKALNQIFADVALCRSLFALETLLAFQPQLCMQHFGRQYFNKNIFSIFLRKFTDVPIQLTLNLTKNLATGIVDSVNLDAGNNIVLKKDLESRLVKVFGTVKKDFVVELQKSIASL